MLLIFFILVIIIFVISKNQNKPEFSTTFKEFYKNVRMEDFNRNNGGFFVLHSFSLIVVSFVIIMIKIGMDAKAGIIFSGCMFLIILLSWLSTLTTRRNIIEIIKSGENIQGIITKKEEIQSSEDLYPSYYYYCKFDIKDKNGEKEEINASLPEKLKELLTEGDIIEIIYLKEKNIKCMELPSDEEVKMFFSKKYQMVNTIIASISMGIAIIGLGFLSTINSKQLLINDDFLLKILVLSITITSVLVALYLLFFEKKESLIK